MKTNTTEIKRPKSQTEVDQYIVNFLGNMPICTAEDLIALRTLIKILLNLDPTMNKQRNTLMIFNGKGRRRDEKSI